MNYMTTQGTSQYSIPVNSIKQCHSWLIFEDNNNTCLYRECTFL